MIIMNIAPARRGDDERAVPSPGLGDREVKFRRAAFLIVFLALLCALPARGDEPFRYPEARHGQGELRYIDEIPVLVVQGTPEEVGTQIGMLALKPAESL
jgi:hypothetical protein